MKDGLAMREFVRFELRDHVALVTLDRPEARNAVNANVATELGAILARTEADGEVRAVVLASSHDRVFCAGADLNEISRGNSAALSTPEGGFAGLTRARRAKPWIAAIGGAAFAGGCELALSCDMIVASHTASFGLPEVKRGLFAAAGGPLRLQRLLPRGIALELIATGDPLGAERAYQLGMVNRLVEPEQLLSQALDLAATIAANAPLAVRESLAIARSVSDAGDKEYWARSDATRARVLSSPDAKEGPKAFLEKRSPVWQG